MLVSTRGRYALRIMLELGRHEGEGCVPLPVIAENQQISEKYLESILVVLSRAGFLQSLRGKGGGYRLSRAPEKYTADEIVRLAEGTLRRRDPAPDRRLARARFLPRRRHERLPARRTVQHAADVGEARPPHQRLPRQRQALRPSGRGCNQIVNIF